MYFSMIRGRFIGFGPCYTVLSSFVLIFSGMRGLVTELFLKAMSVLRLLHLIT